MLLKFELITNEAYHQPQLFSVQIFVSRLVFGPVNWPIISTPVSPLTMLKTMWRAAISLWYDFVSASYFWPDDTFLKEGSDKTYFLVLSSPSRPPPHFYKLNYCWFTICVSFTCTAQWFRVFCRLYSIIGYYKMLGIISYFFLKIAQSCLTLCDPMDYTVHGIPQARILEWVAFPFSRGSSQARDQTQVSRIAGGFFTS